MTECHIECHLLKVDASCELFSRFLFGFFGDVGINIHGCLNVRMAETLSKEIKNIEDRKKISRGDRVKL